MDDSIPFAGREYFIFVAVLAFSRGMDFLSTWVAAPHLVLEGNPIAKWLGWKWGAVVNFILVGTLALWPLSAIIVSTASVLVAARNFQSAWLMRSMGEEAYRDWYVQRMTGTPITLYLVCLAGNTLLVAAVADCFLLSFRGVARANKFAWNSLSCEVHGTLERPEGKTRFTKILVKAQLRAPAGTDEAKAVQLMQRAEHVCLISNSLVAERHIEATVVIE